VPWGKQLNQCALLREINHPAFGIEKKDGRIKKTSAAAPNFFATSLCS